MNRYLEILLYRVVAGYLKIQNSPTACINADELVFDSSYGWKQLLWVVRVRPKRNMWVSGFF
jgi:hypothetical protein